MHHFAMQLINKVVITMYLNSTNNKFLSIWPDAQCDSFDQTQSYAKYYGLLQTVERSRLLQYRIHYILKHASKCLDCKGCPTQTNISKNRCDESDINFASIFTSQISSALMGSIYTCASWLWIRSYTGNSVRPNQQYLNKTKNESTLSNDQGRKLHKLSANKK